MVEIDLLINIIRRRQAFECKCLEELSKLTSKAKLRVNPDCLIGLMKHEYDNSPHVDKMLSIQDVIDKFKETTIEACNNDVFILEYEDSNL